MTVAPDALLGALRSGDAAAVARLLADDPSLVECTAPGGESLVLHACYVGAAASARVFAGGRPLDACEAAALGDTAALAAAFTRDANAHALFSGDGWTPLHLAGFFGQDACAELLLASDASLTVSSKNSTCNTPLHAALAGSTNTALVQRLVAAGADVRARGEHSITPLHLAAARGDRSMCELLIAHGAEIGAAMDDGTQPLTLAIARGHPELGAMLTP